MSCRNLPIAALLFALPLAVQAAEPGAGEKDGVGALWINPGFYAYHFQRDRHLNNRASGFGAEYQYSGTVAFAAGGYHNSNWGYSNYLACYWTPLRLGPLRLGAVVGAVDGYPGTRHGNWFPAILPTASLEYGRIGLNVYYVPSYRNSINGSITFQLKLRIF